PVGKGAQCKPLLPAKRHLAQAAAGLLVNQVLPLLCRAANAIGRRHDLLLELSLGADYRAICLGGRTAWNDRLRGFCPSCGARRMADGAAWLVDQILPERPIRQWVLSLPFPMRFLLATHPALIGRVLGIVYRVIAGHLIRQAGFTQQ